MKTHYEQRMEADLAEIRRKLRKVSDLVESQVQKAVHSIGRADRDLANEVILGDRQVNRRIKQLDYLCHAFIVRHAPSAGHLRFASATLRLDVALERIGDYAGTVGREVVRLTSPPPGPIGRDMDLIAQQARHTLSQGLKAFHEGDMALAKETYGLADQTDLTLENVIADLLEAGERRELPLRDIFSMLRIVNLIKRVAEQAENICEQTMFAVSGATRDRRIYRVLFVDERNDRASQIAEAYARKAFPESGTYASAGWNPARALDPALVAFMDDHGVDMRGARPTKLLPLKEEAEHFHVVVGLAPGTRERIGDVPYRTTVLEWTLDAPEGMEEDALKELYETLVVRVQDLIETLAGPDAA